MEVRQCDFCKQEIIKDPVQGRGMPSYLYFGAGSCVSFTPSRTPLELCDVCNTRLKEIICDDRLWTPIKHRFKRAYARKMAERQRE